MPSKNNRIPFFSSAHGTFSMIDGHKSSLGKFKKIEIVSSIFSNHNAMRLDINYRKKSVKNTNTWRLNNTLLNNQEITESERERQGNVNCNNIDIAKTWKQKKGP